MELIDERDFIARFQTPQGTLISMLRSISTCFFIGNRFIRSLHVVIESVITERSLRNFPIREILTTAKIKT